VGEKPKMKKIFWILTILLVSNANLLVASDWRLVVEFDKTPTYKKSAVKSINCYDSSNCYAVIQHLNL